MDGNRRWAKAKGKPAAAGHREGSKTLETIARACEERDIKHLVVYAFSSENWKRSDEEVNGLMDLFRDYLARQIDRKDRERVAIHMVGDLSRFPPDIQESIEKLHQDNPHKPEYHAWVLVSYGGRSEIVAAVNQCVKDGEEVTEETFEKALWTGDMPDPDIIIRTGGQKRLSNFLTWKSTYSEFFFVDTPWPAFSKDEFFSILDAFAERQRNYGK
jgi:undecaprenyl diphosphate synthase